MNDKSPSAAPESHETESAFQVPAGLTVVANTRKYRKINDYGLVILSMNLPYWVFPHGERYFLCVKSGNEEPVRIQLKKYRRESRNWPPRLPEVATVKWYLKDYWPVALYMILLSTVYAAQIHYPGVLEQFGKLNPELVKDGREWWRLVTALTLHGDIGHLTANLLSGSFFLALLCRLFNRHGGLLLLLLSGICGNLLSVLMQTAPWHNSLGASTAIFGALGLLVGHAVYHGIRDLKSDRPFLARAAPAAAGLALLAILGTGGDNTDTPAHLFGFISGIPMGLLTVWVSQRWPLSGETRKSFLWAPTALTLVILATAWAALIMA